MNSFVVINQIMNYIHNLINIGAHYFFPASLEKTLNLQKTDYMPVLNALSDETSESQILEELFFVHNPYNINEQIEINGKIFFKKYELEEIINTEQEDSFGHLVTVNKHDLVLIYKIKDSYYEDYKKKEELVIIR